MQTLEIVPTEGERERKPTSFSITGRDSKRQSFTYAILTEGTIKGFTLVWPPEETRVMSRVAQTMRQSFKSTSGLVLPDIAEDPIDQRIDLLAGVKIRSPLRSRSGFYIDRSGAVLTTVDAIQACGRVTLSEDVEAKIAASDADLGLAVLKPETPLAPAASAAFRSDVPRLRSEVAVAGFSYEDVIDLPSVTFGTLADIRGLSGEDSLHRLEIETLPGDAGGPVFDRTGAVMGILKPKDNGSRTLPGDVGFAVSVDAIARFLLESGFNPAAASETPPLEPEDLVTLAADLTVLVSCWE